ncbi:MAG: hypothetical protein RIA69_17615 [Cyclobacteriaceae bacterium]
MNKQKFVDFLRRPHNISDKDLEEIQNTVEEFPYFQSARTVIAKASKIKGLPSAKAEITRASIYATDRAHLKKYIIGDLIFLKPLDVHDSHEGEKKSKNIVSVDSESTKGVESLEKDLAVAPDENPSKESYQKDATPTLSASPDQVETDSPTIEIEAHSNNKSAVSEPSAEKATVQETNIEFEDNVSHNEPRNKFTIPEKPESDLDHLIESIFSDIKELKTNRARFEELEKKIEEEDAVNDAVEKATKKAQENSDTSLTEDTNNPKEETAQKKNEELEISPSDIPSNEAAAEVEKKEEPAPESEIESAVSEETKQEEPSAKDVSAKDGVDQEVTRDVSDKSEPDDPTPLPKRILTKKRAAKKVAPKKIDTNTTISNKKVVKGESAIEKAAAKMRASGKIKDHPAPPITDAPKGDASVNNTPPEKIIKTYIRKRSSERATKSESDTSSNEKSGGKDDQPDPSGYSDPNEIIENFIQTQPSITPNKDNESISLGDLSELSTVFNPEVASEYLAEIFLEQGKVDKAILIYEQLILKFPDNSTYFADIIKKLKD